MSASDFRLAELAGVLDAIEQHDTVYPQRYKLVLRALSLAADAGLIAGIKLDPNEGPDWPVAYIDLPERGQVSWHLPAYPHDFDGHTTAEKYDRCRNFRWDMLT